MASTVPANARWTAVAADSRAILNAYRARLEELVAVVRDKMTTPSGAMHLTFNPDLTPPDKKTLEHQDWKAAYHTSRAMLGVFGRATRLSGK